MKHIKPQQPQQPMFFQDTTKKSPVPTTGQSHVTMPVPSRSKFGNG